MTNEEKYKTAYERSVAFDRHCAQKMYKCRGSDCDACHFRWLKSKVNSKSVDLDIVTNADYYQSIRARRKAFKEFCSERKCGDCPLVDMRGDCRFNWLNLIYKKNRRR